MENTCYRCNAQIPSSAPFCPACGAPQIRVNIGQQPVPAPGNAVGADELKSSRYSSFLHSSATAPNAIRWAHALPRVAASALATVALLQMLGVLTGLPAFAFLAIPAGGILAVFLYSRREPGHITGGMGARLGAVTGFVVFLIYLAIGMMDAAIDRQKLTEMLRKTMQDAAAKNPNPQTDAVLRQLTTPEGMMALIIVATVVFLFVSLILGTAGGSLGAFLMRGKKDRD